MNADNVTVNCRGMQCPAPILQIAKAARSTAAKPAVLHVYADDCDFPADLEAWCRTAKAELAWADKESDGAFHALVALNGASLPRAETPPAAPTAAPPVHSPVPLTGSDDVLDLAGLAPHVAVMRLSAVLLSSPAGVRVSSDDPGFPGALYGWSAATRATIGDVQQAGGRFTARVSMPAEVAAAVPAPQLPAAVAPQLPAPVAAPQLPALAADAVPRENRATLLVLHNDLEALLAAMLVANACAATGMQTVVFFSFWGVNALRGHNPDAKPEPKGFLQRMMQWMMPAGPQAQVLGKMNMAGMGTGMMKHFMKQNNVLGLDELMQQAVEMGVTFQVCTMSMGVMGIQKADLMKLPNLEFAGVTSFAESSRRSAMSMVF